jgi:ADP-L-glycero-D-manno-heptose 6-epimerase
LDLVGRYQSFTEADLGALRSAGYDGAFMPVEVGVARYLDWLKGRAPTNGAAGLAPVRRRR